MQTNKRKIIGNGFAIITGCNDPKLAALIKEMSWWWSRSMTLYNLSGEALKIGENEIAEMWQSKALEAETKYVESKQKINGYKRPNYD